MSTELINLSDKKLGTTETRVLELLGQGIGPEQASAALGISTSRISQLMSDPDFSELVSRARFENLQKHNIRDTKLDSLEDKIINKIDNQIDMMYKPMELVRSLQVVNAAKRRGSSTPDSMLQKQEVTQLIMPVAIMNQVTMQVKLNQVNQVVQAGQDSLITVQSGSMESLLKNRRKSLPGAQDVPILDHSTSSHGSSS